MNMKHWWWKILGALIMAYVLVAGFLVPIKPGILTVSPSSVKAGSQTSFEVNGYNANYDTATDLKAWLKLDSTHYLPASNIAVSNHNLLKATFDIPAALPGTDTLFAASMIVDSKEEGYSLLPNAVFIKETSLGEFTGSTTSKIDVHQLDKFQFPFRNILYETIRNTFFHVAIWMAMFYLMTVALIYSIRYLLKPSAYLDNKASSYTSISLLYGILGLVTGAIWAKFTWGAFWTSDVKLNMAAIAVLIYLAYAILRGSIPDVDKKARVAAAYNIFAYFAMIPLLLIIPRMTDSLHPGNGGNPAFGGEDLDNTLRMVFYPSIIALILIGSWIANLRYRLLEVKEAWLNRN